MVRNRILFCHGRFVTDDTDGHEGALGTEWQGRKIELNAIAGTDHQFIDKERYPLECEISPISVHDGSIKFRVLRILNFIEE